MCKIVEETKLNNLTRFLKSKEVSFKIETFHIIEYVYVVGNWMLE